MHYSHKMLDASSNMSSSSVGDDDSDYGDE